MRTPTNRHYQRPETTSGDLNTPVTFYVEGGGGWGPGGDTEKEQLYFCMAEHYEGSIKDYEVVNTENAEFVVTILIPHPREDYIPEYKHWFELEDIMYTGKTFNIQSIAPAKQKGLLKLVGVAYGS